jgi:hypothetical protein
MHAHGAAGTSLVSPAFFEKQSLGGRGLRPRRSLATGEEYFRFAVKPLRFL